MSRSASANDESRNFAPRKSIMEHVIDRVSIPPYQPSNAHWEITFSALGWERETIDKFWIIFCKINHSRSQEITIFEFLNYFNLDRSEYVEKCFEYFDTTGGDSIDFLEFMVSVWNICTLKIDTLTNFTFDIYDLDSDGELSLPEIERMVYELYGSDTKLCGIGIDVLNDVYDFAESRGGVLDQNSFTIYTMNHSMLLFPVFKIQRVIQSRVVGLKYWEDVQRYRIDNVKGEKTKVFDPRHVQILLRTYRTGGVAAILAHTGDPNVALQDWFEKHDANEKLKTTIDVPHSNYNSGKSRWKPVRDVVEKIKKSKAKELKSQNSDDSKPVGEMAAKAFIDARKRTMNSLHKVYTLPSVRNGLKDNGDSKSSSRFRMKQSALYGTIAGSRSANEEHREIMSNNGKKGDVSRKEAGGISTRDLHTYPTPKEDSAYNFHDDENTEKCQSLSSTVRIASRQKNRRRRARPNTAPVNTGGSGKLITPHRRPKTRDVDHRMKMKVQLRPRTPGNIVYSITDDGADFQQHVISKQSNV